MPTTVQARLEYLQALESSGGKRVSHKLGGLVGGGGMSEGVVDRSTFINFVELLNNQLAKYWKDDQRVSVVKLVIQVAKMLAEPGSLIHCKLSIKNALFLCMCVCINNYNICFQTMMLLTFIHYYSFFCPT